MIRRLFSIASVIDDLCAKRGKDAHLECMDMSIANGTARIAQELQHEGTTSPFSVVHRLYIQNPSLTQLKIEIAVTESPPNVIRYNVRHVTLVTKPSHHFQAIEQDFVVGDFQKSAGVSVQVESKVNITAGNHHGSPSSRSAFLTCSD